MCTLYAFIYLFRAKKKYLNSIESFFRCCIYILLHVDGFRFKVMYLFIYVIQSIPLYFSKKCCTVMHSFCMGMRVKRNHASNKSSCTDNVHRIARTAYTKKNPKHTQSNKKMFYVFVWVNNVGGVITERSWAKAGST